MNQVFDIFEKNCGFWYGWSNEVHISLKALISNRLSTNLQYVNTQNIFYVSEYLNLDFK